MGGKKRTRKKRRLVCSCSRRHTVLSIFKQIRHSDERTSVYPAPVSTEPTLALNHRNNVGSLGYVRGKANRVELLRPMKR